MRQGADYDLENVKHMEHGGNTKGRGFGVQTATGGVNRHNAGRRKTSRQRRVVAV